MPSSDIYTIGGEVPESATEGTTITFNVTLNDPENSAILGVTVEPTFDASYDIASNNGTYSFVMPASPVKIIIDARAYAEVLSDGRFDIYDEQSHHDHRERRQRYDLGRPRRDAAH